MTRLLPFVCLLFLAGPVLAGDEIEIQAELKAVKYFKLQPKHTYVLDAPLRLGPDMVLEGCGKSSVLEYRGAQEHGPYAILFGEPSANIYGAWIRDFAIADGGVHFRRLAQHCGAERVWAVNAPAAGFLLDGIGDYFLMRDCVAWDGLADGIVIRSNHGKNGITLEHCNAQGNAGAGLIVETFDKFAAYIAEFVARDCVFQGNGRGGEAVADVVLGGTLVNPRFEHCYIEAVHCSVAMSVEPRKFLDDARNRPRSPQHLIITAGSKFEGKSMMAALDLQDGAVGVTITDSRLRAPINKALGVAMPVQSGAFSAAVMVDQLRPAAAVATGATQAAPVVAPAQ